MANSLSARASLALDIVLDSNATSASGTPVSIICNRQYDVRDFCVAVTTAEGVAGDNAQLIVESVPTTGAAVVIANVDCVTTGWKRATTLAVGAAPTSNALLTTTTVQVSVPRGNAFRVRALSALAGAGNLGATIRGNGTFVILPGNRYAAATSTSAYYANNTASGNNSGTVSI
jgi:hypothetical protein